jgi:putative endopeptidase
MSRRLAVCGLAAALFGCATSQPAPKPEAAPLKPEAAAPAPVPAPPPAPVWSGPPAVDEAALDKAASPCDDFYQYACGGWIKATTIPADKPSWIRSFSTIAERNEQVVRQILEEAAAGKGDETNPWSKKIGDYYGACIDEAKAETASLSTLQAQLREIDGLKSAKQVPALLARLHLEGSGALFNFGSDQDAKDATQVIGIADQGGMGLPDRDYYLKEGNQKLRDAYQQLVVNQLVHIGEKQKQAEADAKVVLRIETALAKAAMDKVERRDPYKTYHRLDRKGLVQLAPAFGWDGYFAALGQPGLQAINVVTPDFFKAVGELAGAKANLKELKTYLRWQAVDFTTPTLGKAFLDEKFAFTSQLNGAKEQPPRWKRCVAMTVMALPEGVGRSYVARTFGKASKPMALEMVQRVEAAFEQNLDSLPWMDAATKARAHEKVHSMANKIGYTDAWRDYTSLEVGSGSLLANFLAAHRFASAHELAKIGRPVDRTEHQMPPTLVNAQYNPTMNDMTFPAAILQPPFFSADSFAAANFGGIGMVVGHELTHGFDDEGRQFDADGNLKDWWTKESGEAYVQRAACVSKQYSGYEVAPGVHINGDLTLGENIADNGGLKMALLAFRELRKDQPQVLQGSFTEEQQLFLAFAQSWCATFRPQMLELQAKTDPHSNARFRVNGSVSNSAEFGAAFQCKAGSPMAPAERCTVW